MFINMSVCKPIIWKVHESILQKDNILSLWPFSMSCFDIFVSQAIDDRVEQWVDHSVEQDSHFVILQGVGEAWP